MKNVIQSNGPFYIVDEDNGFQRFHPRYMTPDTLTLGSAWEDREYAAKFHSYGAARKQLEVWASNCDFTGRVINRTQADMIVTRADA